MKEVFSLLIEKSIDDYIDYVELIRGLSPGTIKRYREELNLFFLFLKERGFPLKAEEITIQHLRNYLVYIKKERNSSSATLRNKTTIIKVFFNFLYQEEIYGLKQNPALKLSNIKVDKKLPQILSLEDSKKFLRSIKEVSSFPQRDYAMFLIFLHTGCRLNELKELTLSQVNLREQFIKFRGKGDKERVIPLLEDSIKVLEDYLKVRAPAGYTDICFLNNKGYPLSKGGIQSIFKRLARKTGIYREGLSIHKLRHTCLTLLLKEGLDLRTLQEIAGHASISTTQIYTHVAQTELKKQMNKHPLANIVI